MGQKRGKSGHSTGKVGCGGMWLRKMGQKMGEKWDKIPSFHSPIFPVVSEVKGLCHSSFCGNQLTALTNRKMATH